MQQTRLSAEATIGNFMVDVGQGPHHAHDAAATEIAVDDNLSAIDQFYSLMERSGDSLPHPMDELAAPLLFDRLRKRRQ